MARKQRTVEDAGTFFPYKLRWDGSVVYLIWFGGNGDRTDGVFVDGEEKMPTFRSMRTLKRYATEKGLVISDEKCGKALDFDALSRWIQRPARGSIRCADFLAAWNLFSDILSTFKGHPSHIDGRREQRIYRNLFHGSNLPAVTPEGRKYKPIWSQDEVVRLRRVLARGSRLFSASAVRRP
jgi:hypothetical protein